MKTVIIGGGIAGLETAIYLRKYGQEVTLVSERDYLYLYPTSIWIPTSGTRFEDVALPLAPFAQKHGFELVIDTVNAIDKAQNSIVCATQTLSYDNLVIAVGAGKMKPKGIEHAPSICGAAQEALSIKEQLEALIAKGSGVISMGFGGNPNDTSAVRGGPAFEVIFNVHNHLKKLGLRDKFSLNFFAPMARPGQKMGEKSVDMMISIFKRLDIGMYFGKKITGFSAEGVHFEDDSVLKSDMMMFISAGAGHPLVKEAGLPLNEAGFVQIDPYCQVRGTTNIYAVGDVAAIEGVEWRAKQGHLAEAMGRAVALNISEKAKGSPKREGYQEHMSIVCLMDDGRGGALIYRSTKRSFMLPLPILGHWAKKGWGWYYKNSKMNRIPRIPGM
ncbi:MAG: sulfide:quinone reductase [Sulfurovum sp. PC08-66]|nr:MAG: sulfide:quinone reductase [Sulfurovum sp. PC08-66]KIM12613.1 MAG: sulfide:quinone reductase [Sulfuricurvum sp. PC08-66]